MNVLKAILKHNWKNNRIQRKSNNASQSSAEYCMNLVKNHDYENFISTILLKQKSRTCAFAIRSFNVEIAKIAEQVSQKDIGLMRMQFWEDTLDKCFGNDLKQVPKHPVAIELFKAVNVCKLSKRNLRNLITSRKEQMQNASSFNTLEDLERYSEQSVSNVYYLILQGCGVKNINADHAASHLGKAQGITQQLRSVPQSQRLNFIPLPQSVLTKYSVSHEEILRLISSKALSDCIYEVATRAHQHLTKARSIEKDVPMECRSVFLPAVTIFIYLDRLQKVDYDIFHPKLKYSSWNLLAKMWFANFRNTY